VVAAVVSSRDGEARGGEMEKGKGKEGIDDVRWEGGGRGLAYSRSGR
jgi:hypothetical protein